MVVWKYFTLSMPWCEKIRSQDCGVEILYAFKMVVWSYFTLSRWWCGKLRFQDDGVETLSRWWCENYALKSKTIGTPEAKTPHFVKVQWSTWSIVAVHLCVCVWAGSFSAILHPQHRLQRPVAPAAAYAKWTTTASQPTTNQSSNQSINQSINRSIDRSVD